MPSLPVKTQQPSPVSPQVEMPPEFPAIPREVLDRFPSAKDWQVRLDEFWTRSKQSIEQAQTQAANYANSRVTYSVDSFRIYAKNGIPQPMFALDSTGIKLGDTLVISTVGRKVFIGEGQYADAQTPFYIDTLGRFSLGANLTWDPDTSTLTITGIINATSGTIGGFSIGTDYIRDVANSFGLASTVTGGDDVRFWAGATFANRATAPFKVTEAGVLAVTTGAIGGFTLTATTLSSGANATYVELSTIGTAGLQIGTGTSNRIFLKTAAGGFSGLFLANTSGNVIGRYVISDADESASAYIGGGVSFTNDAITITGSTSKIELGTALDTNLYRSAANTLKTDDAFIAAGDITGANFIAPTFVTAQFDKTTDTTFANVTGLSINVVAGKTYSFQAVLFVAANATGQSKVAAAGTCTVSTFFASAVSKSATSVVTEARTGTKGAEIYASANAVPTYLISGTVVVSGSGTLTIQFAQAAANGTSSVLVGSSFQVWV